MPPAPKYRRSPALRRVERRRISWEDGSPLIPVPGE